MEISKMADAGSSEIRSQAHLVPWPSHTRLDGRPPKSDTLSHSDDLPEQRNKHQKKERECVRSKPNTRHRVPSTHSSRSIPMASLRVDGKNARRLARPTSLSEACPHSCHCGHSHAVACEPLEQLESIKASRSGLRHQVAVGNPSNGQRTSGNLLLASEGWCRADTAHTQVRKKGPGRQVPEAEQPTAPNLWW